MQARLGAVPDLPFLKGLSEEETRTIGQMVATGLNTP